MVSKQCQDGSSKQYKVTLNLSKSEIDLIRYTWHRMLVDDEETTNTIPPERMTSPELPGSFPGEQQVQLDDIESSQDGHSYASSNSRTIKFQSSTMAASSFCRQFYTNFISRDESLESMYVSLKHQAVSFAAVLSLAVMQLEDLSTLDDHLSRLGKLHTRVLNIEPVYYELMGEALIQTFHERFGTKFNTELEILWIKLYLYLANTILQFGIDPVMNYDTGLSYNNPRKGRNGDDFNFNADGKSVMTLRTSMLHTEHKKNTSINSIPGSPHASYSLSRQGTPKLSSTPGKSIIKTKRKKDCVIM